MSWILNIFKNEKLTNTDNTDINICIDEYNKRADIYNYNIELYNKLELIYSAFYNLYYKIAFLYKSSIVSNEQNNIISKIDYCAYSKIDLLSNKNLNVSIAESQLEYKITKINEMKISLNESLLNQQTQINLLITEIYSLFKDISEKLKIISNNDLFKEEIVKYTTLSNELFDNFNNEEDIHLFFNNIHNSVFKIIHSVKQNVIDIYNKKKY